MRHWWLAIILIVLGSRPTAAARPDPAHGGDAMEWLNTTLAGEYDNEEQVRQARAALSPVAVPHVLERWRLLDSGRDHGFWIWHLRTQEQANGADAMWLYKITSNGRRITAVPYRPMDPAKMLAELADPKLSFRFVPERWAELAPCALSGEWKNTQFSAATDVTACRALLPGLGDAAPLLPLRFTFDGEMLRTATFADQARGADATLDARRVRWYRGWSAINGGGPNAKAGNQDWHTHDDLRLASEGGRIPLRWRDGAASGYSIELQRRTYAERKLSVLQLNVIEDASGRTIDYAWTSPNADAVGINLGWLQVGLQWAGE